MRENLFRGKRRDNGEWVYGSLFVGFKKSYICPEAIAMYNFDGALCIGRFVEVDPETVGQYTGLHDATKWENLPEKEQQEFLRIHKKEDWNGKKIFEGDIMAFAAYGFDYAGSVEIVDGNASVMCKHASPFLDQAVSKHGAYIIGNVHGNPDLLLESKEECNT